MSIRSLLNYEIVTDIFECCKWDAWLRNYTPSTWLVWYTKFLDPKKLNLSVSGTALSIWNLLKIAFFTEMFDHFDQGPVLMTANFDVLDWKPCYSMMYSPSIQINDFLIIIHFTSTLPLGYSSSSRYWIPFLSYRSYNVCFLSCWKNMYSKKFALFFCASSMRPRRKTHRCDDNIHVLPSLFFILLYVSKKFSSES